EQSAGEQVVARRDADRDLARWARIELGWAPAALAASFAESLVRDAEELVLGQFVQVVGGQSTADVGGRCGLVAPDWSVLAGDGLVRRGCLRSPYRSGGGGSSSRVYSNNTHV